MDLALPSLVAFSSCTEFYIPQNSLIPSASQVSSSSELSPIHSTTSHKTQESFSLKEWGLETNLFLSCICSKEVSHVHHRCSMNPLLVGNIYICMDTEPNLLVLITINIWHLLLWLILLSLISCLTTSILAYSPKNILSLCFFILLSLKCKYLVLLVASFSEAKSIH